MAHRHPHGWWQASPRRHSLVLVWLWMVVCLPHPLHAGSATGRSPATYPPGEDRRVGRDRGHAEVHVSIPPPGYRPLMIVSTLDTTDGRLRIPVSAFDRRLVVHLYRGRVRILNDSLTHHRVDLYFVQTPHLEPADQETRESGPSGCFAKPSPSPDVRVAVACDAGDVHGLLGTWEALSNVITVSPEPPSTGLVELYGDGAMRLQAYPDIADPLLVFAGDDNDPSRSSARTRAGYRFFWVDLRRVEHDMAQHDVPRMCADFLVLGGGHGGGFTGLDVPRGYVALWLTVPRSSRIVHVLGPPEDAFPVRVSTEFAAVAYHDAQRRALFVDNDTPRPVTGRMCLVRTIEDGAIAANLPRRPPTRRFFDPFPPSMTTDREALPRSKAKATPITVASRPGAPVPSRGDLDEPTANEAPPFRESPPVASKPGGGHETARPRPLGPDPEMSRPPVPVRRAAQPGEPDERSAIPTQSVDVAYVHLTPRSVADTEADTLEILADLQQRVGLLDDGGDVSRTFQVATSRGAEATKVTITRLDAARYSLLVSRRDGAGHWRIADIRPIFGARSGSREAEAMERVTTRPVFDTWRVLWSQSAGRGLPFPGFLQDELTEQLTDDLRPLMAAIPRGIMDAARGEMACTVLALSDGGHSVTRLTIRVRYLGLRDYDYFSVRLEEEGGREVASRETWRPRKDLLGLINARVGTSLTRSDFR